MTVKDLQADEYNSYYDAYLRKTKDVTLKDGLRSNLESNMSFLKGIPEIRLDYRYSEGKWTIKEIILHIIDTERIFTYRALCIARQDQSMFPGFDQDAYVPVSNANERSFRSLLDEYKAVRLATTALFDSFDDKVLLQTGTASNSVVSVRALGFILLGHENHHCEIIRDRYL
jgi:uncharacterized damage-inducible protein DinB